MSALEKQVAGGHYTKCSIQPIEYIHANNLPFIEGNVVKYIKTASTSATGDWHSVTTS